MTVGVKAFLLIPCILVYNCRSSSAVSSTADRGSLHFQPHQVCGGFTWGDTISCLKDYGHGLWLGASVYRPAGYLCLIYSTTWNISLYLEGGGSRLKGSLRWGLMAFIDVSSIKTPLTTSLLPRKGSDLQPRNGQEMRKVTDLRASNLSWEKGHLPWRLARL